MSEPKRVKFNLNDLVYVRMTDIGRQAYSDSWREIGMTPKPKEEDEHGWSRWPLWELMELFGPHTGIGRKLPIDTDIEFEIRISEEPAPE